MAGNNNTNGEEYDDDGSGDGAHENMTNSASSPSRRRSCCRLFGLLSLSVIGLIFIVVQLGVGLWMFRRDYHTSPVDTWMMVGGLTATSVAFRAKVPSNQQNPPIFRVSADPSFAANVTNIAATQINGTGNNGAGADMLYRGDVTGLQPDTVYLYRLISSDGTNDNSGMSTGTTLHEGTFTTPAPTGTAMNFTVATSYGGWTGSNHDIYRQIQDHDPLFFLQTGDFHYADIVVDDYGKRLDAVSTSMASTSLQGLLLDTPLAYMWDDHDYLGNNAGFTESPARATALQTFRDFFPHHELAAMDNVTVAPYHAFTVGTVRFILTDLRSEATDTDMYFATQKEWFFDELRTASASDQFDFVIWVSTKPWIGTPKQTDGWRGYERDRAELSTLISDLFAEKGNFLALASDAHSVGFDDGRNTYYGNATSGALSFPILYAGPLDRLGSVKGGPFSDGCHATRYERNHHYATLDFEINNNNNDNTTKKCIHANAYDEKGNVLVDQTLCAPFFVSSTTEPKGSCTAQTISTAATIYLAVALVLVLLVASASCFFLSSKCTAAGLGLIVLLSYVIAVTVGLNIPFLNGVPHFETQTVGLVGMIQAIVTASYCAGWFYQEYQCRQQNQNSRGAMNNDHGVGGQQYNGHDDEDTGEGLIDAKVA